MSQQQPERTLGGLFADASRDFSALIRSEIELAKAEVRRDVKNGATGGAMFGAAAFLGLLAVVLLSIAAAYGLVAAGLHPGWAFLIVAVVFLVVAAVLALVGKRAVAKVGPPERTIRTSKETAAYLKNRRSTNADTTRAPNAQVPSKT
jgi:membrane protein implicated in regulation of membrane protease activity